MKSTGAVTISNIYNNWFRATGERFGTGIESSLKTGLDGDRVCVSASGTEKAREKKEQKKEKRRDEERKREEKRKSVREREREREQQQQRACVARENQ